MLDPAEVQALLAACTGHGVTDIRNRALIALLYRSGLRISEALSLHPKDIDPTRGSVRVLRGKGGKARTAGIDAGALEYVAAWLAIRSRLPMVGPLSPLFCSRHGSPVTAGYVRRMLPTLARNSGVLKRVHAHGFRHTHAAELRSEGVDIGIISKQLGHNDISTTARYLDHIAPWQVVEVVSCRAWDCGNVDNL